LSQLLHQPLFGKTIRNKAMKVEELSQYGKALEMPKEALAQQKKVIFKTLRKEFGLLGILRLMLKAQKEVKRIKKEFPEAVASTLKIGDDMDKQMCLLGGIYFAIADKRGRKAAYSIMKQIMQNVAPVSMPAMYQLGELVKCEGDVFTNYKNFNQAMFTEIDRKGTWKNSGFNETNDLLEFKVTSCLNVDFYNAIGCPDVAKLGCDHDLAGYPLIERATQSEFRRPCTLAKEGEYCHFQFYRKGTAPDNAHLNK
jgi:hypothetical protein